MCTIDNCSIPSDSPSCQTPTSHGQDSPGNHIYATLQQLRADTTSVAASFASISSRLRKLDSADLSTETRLIVSRLQNEWRAIHNEYRRLMWEAKDIAGDARVASDDVVLFIRSVLNHQEDFMLGLQAQIRAYQSEVERDAVKGRDLSDGFKFLQQKTELFQETWKKEVCDSNLFAAVNASTIKSLNKEITKLTTQIVAIVGLTVIVAAGAGAAAVLLAMHGFTEPATVGAAITLVRGLMKRVKNKVHTRQAIGEKIKDIRRSSLTDSEDSQNDLQNIARKLGGIAHFWEAISVDLSNTERMVERLLNDGRQDIRLIVEEHLKRLLDAYTRLSMLFREYQTDPPQV